MKAIKYAPLIGLFAIGITIILFTSCTSNTEEDKIYEDLSELENVQSNGNTSYNNRTQTMKSGGN